MINYVSYFLFFFGNFLFIFFIDNDLAYDFLSVYSISGLIIGPFIFFYFSKLRESIKYSKILIIFLNLSLFFISDFLVFLIILYSINLFYCDFLSSQSNNYKINFYFKLSFFLSVIPFILNIFDINQLLIFRVLICTITIFYFYFTNYSYDKIIVKSPIFYFLSTNFSYFGSLYIITFFLKGFVLKITYIFFQICFSIILKLYDLKIRRIMQKVEFTFLLNIVNLILILLPLMFLNLEISYIIFLVYYSNILILYLIKKYLI